MYRRTASLIAISLLAVACSTPGGSGGPGSSLGPGASQGTVESSGPGESAGPGASQGGGGGVAGDACGLLTAGEVAAAAGVASTTTTSSGDDPSYCSYNSDGSLVAATSLGTKDVEMVYGIYSTEAGAVAVSGMGEKAAYSPSTYTLYIVSKGRLVGITAGSATITPEQRLALEKQLGEIAAGRL